MIPSESRMRENPHVRFDERGTEETQARGAETEAPAQGESRRPTATATRTLKPGAPAPDSTCAVERRVFLAGAKPAQQLSLRLVAARAVYGGNDVD